MADLMDQLTGTGTPEEKKEQAENLATAVKEKGVAVLETEGVANKLKAALGGDAMAKEGAVAAFAAICKKSKSQCVPFFQPILADVIEVAADKSSGDLRKAASKAAKAYTKVLPFSGAEMLFESLVINAKESAKWQVKVLCLELVGGLVETAAVIFDSRMTSVVPFLSELMWDSKKQVKEAAAKALQAACSCIKNADIQPFVPTLISCIQNPSEVEECVHALAATTFVQTVDAAALSITVPLLDRGFKEPKTAVKRKCAVITENMAKLVDNPSDVAPFMPVLEPALLKASEEVADPECRSRCAAAHQELNNIATRGREVAAVEAADINKVKSAIEGVLTKFKADWKSNKAVQEAFEYLAASARIMGTFQEATSDEWKENLWGYVKPLLPAAANKKADAELAAHEIMQACLSGDAAATGGIQETFEEDADDQKLEQLCDCRFSLAYGSRILLNNSRLFLRRGMRYGIVAAKSAGKTTLLQSIANGQVEGFPVDRLKTVFVQHDISAKQARMNVVDYTLDCVGEEMSLNREEIKVALTNVGFTDEMKDMPITSLSGGWKMKLALVRAMLRKADILLLDEPTNHLDVLNVQWVVDYLTGDVCSNVTSLMVSHDTKFLDNVATHIIHFDTLKLNNYKGNLSKFVEHFPHAKAYYDLSASTLAFRFPTPGPLDGVKSKGRPILSMTDVAFTYPGATKPQLEKVSIRVSMASRIACVGANGAGKSTMIKLLTGELKPSSGQVYKHPNCKFAYVAQHAFHHIEQHLDKTANEYIQWRYQGGEDKEALVKATVKITEEEEAKMKIPFIINIDLDDGKKIKEKRVVEKIISRRKQGKILEYEVKWISKPNDQNLWYPRDKLEELGFKKLLDEVDRRKAAAEGAFQRVLSQANVEKHLEDVGLDRELGTHNRIRSLSGGQKVKVVLAACMWGQPHIIILDEPTNYLDREALGALATAINNFEGGVCLITHNQEFADLTTRETWVVANNRCDIKGDADWAAYAAEAIEIAAMEEDQVDAQGNKIEVKRTPASVNKKDQKKMIKEIKAKIKNEDEMTEFEELCATEWGLFAA